MRVPDKNEAKKQEGEVTNEGVDKDVPPEQVLPKSTSIAGVWAPLGSPYW